MLNDPTWSALGDKVEPAWGPEREGGVRAALARRSGRRRVARGAAATFVAIGLVTAGFALVARRVGPSIAARPARAPLEIPSAPAAPLSPPTTRVTVTRLSPQTRLDPLPDSQGRGFALRAGGARFLVPHDPSRPFVVTAGDVTIEDLGTTFTVRYSAADRLSISVEEGRVRVRAREADTEVSAGTSLELAVSPMLPPAGDQTHAQPQARQGVPSPAWRPLAERGQYKEAHKALRRGGPGAVRDDTADLLLAADAARLSGHPADAVPYLERIVRDHARDPRAGVAAFTLGRVLLEELDRPAAAVDAFAHARASGGPLAEDALARQVEASSRSGDVARSRELARLYRRLYPDGRRAKAVSRFGGLD